MLPTISQKLITKMILRRELEDSKLIGKIESFLIRKRDFVFQIPKPKTPIILLLSGGLDTVVVWAILMDIYHLNVYPVFLRRGQRRVRQEEKSVDYFSCLYVRKYPQYYHAPMKINSFIPPMEIRWPITEVSNNPIIKDAKQWRGIPVYTSLLVSYATQYAYYLEITSQISIRTIVLGFVLTDGETMAYETLSAIRAVNLMVCSLTNDYSWQITSLPLEKELRFYWGKDVLIKWAHDHRLPIENTYSCFRHKAHHCGVCIGCHNRQEAFRKAMVKDQTIYRNRGDISNFVARLKNKLRIF